MDGFIPIFACSTHYQVYVQRPLLRYNQSGNCLKRCMLWLERAPALMAPRAPRPRRRTPFFWRAAAPLTALTTNLIFRNTG